MTLHIFIYTALCLVIGLLSSKLMKIAKMPNVTGYLIAGLLVGPYCLNLIPNEAVESLSFITEIALGFIALSIGAEFKLTYLKKVGKAPVIIAIMEGLGAVAFVDFALIAFGVDVPFALCLGAIASATAPAATLMVVKQYKANGPVTQTLLPVVAIDDAVALMAFGISVAVAKSIENPSEASLIITLVKPIVEIVASLGVGALLGIVYAFSTKWFTGRGNRTCCTIALVMTCLGLCDMLDLSNLLCCMMMSAVYVNLSKEYETVFTLTDRLTPPIFMLFFFLSGADLNIGILTSVGLVGMIYVIFRVFGKVAGAWLGAKVSKAAPIVQKYLGFTLVPQAGVAIGLATTAMSIVPQHGSQIRTIILCGTVIYELVGPLITKMALIKAGEIKTA